MEVIMTFLGEPPEGLVEAASKKGDYYFPDSPKYKHYLHPKRILAGEGLKGTSFGEFLKVDEESPVVEFLKACLQWRPADRIAPRDAINHPWLRQFIRSMKDRAKH
jgi:hypothetical protein